MELDRFERYTCCTLRLYEEDYNEADIFMLIQTLKNKGFDRILCCRHSKDDAKPHYHLLVIGEQFRASKLYNLGILKHWCSTVDNRKAMYFYIKEHRGKEDEDISCNHKIDLIYDNINYETCPTKGKKYELKNFFLEVDSIINQCPKISKRELLYRLMDENISYMGLYLKHQRFIEDMYNLACYDAVDKRIDNSMYDDEED